MKIVSLLPSATETVCALGLADQLVGVTHECDYPACVADLPKVTRTSIPPDSDSASIDQMVREQFRDERALYQLRGDVLQSLAPDLIITQTLCDVCAVAHSAVDLAIAKLPQKPVIVNLEPTCFADVLSGINTVAIAAESEQSGTELIATLRDRVAAITKQIEQVSSQQRPRVALLEWIDPTFSAGHWNPELVSLAGGDELFGKAGERSSVVSWEQIVAADPDVMIISCCGFDVPRILQDLPILQSRDGWSELTCVRSKRVYVIDGSAYFNRPGPRLVDSLEILAAALHPQVHALPDHLSAATNPLQ